MSEKSNCCPNNSGNGVCIQTDKIYDSCRDKECVENVRVYLTEAHLFLSVKEIYNIKKHGQKERNKHKHKPLCNKLLPVKAFAGGYQLLVRAKPFKHIGRYGLR